MYKLMGVMFLCTTRIKMICSDKLSQALRQVAIFA